jgi:hypothetical protein
MERDNRYTRMDDLWRQGRAFVVPTSCVDLTSDIMRQGHAVSLHGGVNDLCQRTSSFTWTNKAQAALDFVKACPVCQIIDAPRSRPATAVDRPLQGHLHPIIPLGHPSSLIVVDHVPMPISERGNVAILTVTCAFSRLTEAIAVQSMTAPVTLKAFIECFYLRHGNPSSVQFDNHGAFSGVFKKYFADRGIPTHAIHALHSQANGKGERPHGPIQNKLRAVCLGPNIGRWDDALPYVMHAERTRVNRAIGMSPYQAVYGRPVLPDLDTQLDLSHLPLSLSEWHELTQHVHHHIDTSNNLAAYNVKRIFDATRSRVAYFSIGDHVMLLTAHEAANKLIPAWTAGHVISAVDRAPDFYSVTRSELDGTHGPSKEVPVSRLLPFNASLVPDGGASLQTKPGFHGITSIVDHHDDASGLRFTVQWTDGTTSEANLADLVKNCKRMLEAYASSHTIPWDRIKATLNA